MIILNQYIWNSVFTLIITGNYFLNVYQNKIMAIKTLLFYLFSNLLFMHRLMSIFAL